MNRIESAVTGTVDTIKPLDGITTTVPVATPFAVAGVVAGAFVAGAAVGCAEGRCVQDPDEMSTPAGLPGMAVSDLLQARSSAI